jgi:hypothetical protein
MKIKIKDKDENVEVNSMGCLTIGLGCSLVFWLPLIIIVLLVLLVKFLLKI